jgi:dihydrofolate reductase
MRKVTAFNNVSVDGYFVDEKGDMSWAHKRDPEWVEFTSENAGGESVLAFGRVTYDMMAAFWPSEAAFKALPEVAKGMNSAPKLVFSRTMDQALWNNTRLVKGDPAAEVTKLKQEDGPPLLILGSGTIVAQLSEARLVDEYQILIAPIVLGKGRTMFQGLTARLPFKLMKSRIFGNGSVVLWYQPAA